MRDLKRNKREMWYALPVGSQPILDEYGNDTLEVEMLYTTPLLLLANVSASIGQAAVEVFGSQTEYTRTVSLSGQSCPLVENSLVWFGVTPEQGGHNYIVARVADSKNGFLVALREVTPHG